MAAVREAWTKDGKSSAAMPHVETLKSTTKRCLPVLFGGCEASEAAQFIPADLQNWEVLWVLAAKELASIRNVF